VIGGLRFGVQYEQFPASDDCSIAPAGTTDLCEDSSTAQRRNFLSEIQNFSYSHRYLPAHRRGEGVRTARTAKSLETKNFGLDLLDLL
jgi:hypothetical protein